MRGLDKSILVQLPRNAFLIENIPLPKEPWKLPIVLSQHEGTQLIDSANNLMHRAILMTLYSTGMREAELA